MEDEVVERRWAGFAGFVDVGSLAFSHSPPNKPHVIAVCHCHLRPPSAWLRLAPTNHFRSWGEYRNSISPLCLACLLSISHFHHVLVSPTRRIYISNII